jgi:ribosomal protein S18 acetylase RimI-like enzyme
MKYITYSQQWDIHVSHHYIFFIDEKVVASYVISEMKKRTYLSGFYIQPQFRGLKLSFEMMDTIPPYKNLWLKVRCDNLIAKKLYSKYGFTKVRGYDEEDNGFRYEWMRKKKLKEILE